MDDVCAGPRANDVAPDDPNHSISGVNMQSTSPLLIFRLQISDLSQYLVPGTQMRNWPTLELKLRICVGL